jgi:predicted nuclease of predicted toxin-antitoxin system
VFVIIIIAAFFVFFGMAAWLITAGCDAVHTLDLPDKNRTTDQQLLDLADREQRVIVTKDADFVDSHILNAWPAKLLLISTGNISNRQLEALVVPLIPDIVRELQAHSFLELDRSGLVIRE